MRNLVLIAVLVIIVSCAFAQTAADSIETQTPYGTIYLQHGKTLSPKEMKEIVKMNPQAIEEMKLASGNLGVAMVFAYVGGFMIGWPIGTAIGGGKPVWALAGAGAVLVAIAIPLSAAAARHTKNAVRIYNNSLKQISRNAVKMNFGLSGNGIGVRMSF